MVTQELVEGLGLLLQKGGESFLEVPCSKSKSSLSL